MAYEPCPVDTRHVKMHARLAGLIDRLARNVHDVWAAERMDQGWRYGGKLDKRRKLHPGLVPYDRLTKNEKNVDVVVASQLVKCILALGYTIEKDAQAVKKRKRSGAASGGRGKTRGAARRTPRPARRGR